jgi:hypothetical protein
MNNSKTLEVQEVYVKDGEGQGRTSVLHWSDDKSKWVSPIPVKPQSGYLLSREELETFVLDFVEELLELKLSGKPVDSEQLFNQLVKPSPNEASR